MSYMLIFLFISPGIMLVIYKKTNCNVPLRILSIEDGTPLKTFTQLLHRNRKVDFIEQFNEKLLVKQDKENLQIIDVSQYLPHGGCNLHLMHELTLILCPG
jgi:hypothetical protein